MRWSVLVAGVVVKSTDRAVTLDIFEVDGVAQADSDRVSLPWTEIALDEPDPQDGDEVAAEIPGWLAKDRGLV